MTLKVTKFLLPYLPPLSLGLPFPLPLLATILPLVTAKEEVSSSCGEESEVVRRAEARDGILCRQHNHPLGLSGVPNTPPPAECVGHNSDQHLLRNKGWQDHYMHNGNNGDNINNPIS